MRAQRLADYREWRLALGVMVVSDALLLVGLAEEKREKENTLFRRIASVS